MRLQPLGHLSCAYLKNSTEGVGFEPTVLSYNGFQDRRLQPLGHSSALGTLVDAESHHRWAQPGGFATADLNPKVLHGLVGVNISRF